MYFFMPFPNVIAPFVAQLSVHFSPLCIMCSPVRTHDTKQQDQESGNQLLNQVDLFIFC